MRRDIPSEFTRWRVDGDRLRMCRLRRRQSQRTLALAVGITQATLSNYETGRRVAPLSIGLAIAKELCVSLSDLLAVPDVASVPGARFKQVMRALTERPDLIETVALLCLPAEAVANESDKVNPSDATSTHRPQRSLSRAIGNAGRQIAVVA